MNRRKFLKVIGAGTTALAVTTRGGRVIDALAAAPTATPTAIPPAPTVNPSGTVAIPFGGLGSNSNYFLDSDCNPMMGLSLTIEVTKDMVSDIGFSIQWNCYSPQDANCVYQQYGFALDTSNGHPLKVIAWVDNWASKSFKQSQNLPGDLINNRPFMLNLPGATVPAGYKFTINLDYDKDHNVSGATFIVIDHKGKSTSTKIVLESLNVDGSNPPKRVTSEDLAPVIAFELNIVGPDNGKNSYFSAGAGTITYTASTPMTVLSKKPDCCATQSVTAETANTVYGMLPVGPSQTITQPFDIDLSHPYAPNIAFAVSRQFGSDRTDLFAIDNAGQLTIFSVQANGHWHMSKPKSPPELAHPGSALAASQHFGIADQTDVFMIDQLGQLIMFWIVGSGDWNGPKAIGPKGFEGLSRTGKNLAASQHFGIPAQTDVFVVDKTGQLNVFSVVGTGDWSGPQTIGSTGFAQPGAAIAVSQRFGIPNQTDVFLMDTTGQLNVFSTDNTGHWRGPQPIGPAGFAPSGAALVASQHFGMLNQTDVFVVDNHGQLNVFSVIGSGDWSGPQAIGSTGLARSGAALAVSQDFGVPNQTDVFLIDKTGQLNVFSSDSTGQWNGPQTIGAAGMANSGAVVVASQQAGVPNRTDVFCISPIGINGQAWPSLFWAGNSGTWNGPKALVNDI